MAKSAASKRRGTPLNPETIDPAQMLESIKDPKALLKNFTDEQRLIIETKLRYRNMSLADIGRHLGLTRAAIQFQFKSRELEQLMVWLDKDLYHKLDDLREKALDTYRALLSNQDPWIKLAVARDILSGVMQSKHNVPKPAAIDQLLIGDSSRPDEPKIKA